MGNFTAHCKEGMVFSVTYCYGFLGFKLLAGPERESHAKLQR